MNHSSGPTRHTEQCAIQPARLQLGASRLEYLEPSVRACFAQQAWTHLGDAETTSRPLARGPLYVLRHYSLRYVVRRGWEKLCRRDADTRAAAVDLEQLYKDTKFMPWYYRRDEHLPFADATFSYVFSEHFFEHLFLDEAVELLRECRRVMAEGAVIRTCVPDADLRTYAPPEPVGFPDRRMSFDHPSKHKSRWNIYALSEALRAAGFDPIPLTYCDREGHFTSHNPRDLAEHYTGCADLEAAFDMTHIARKRSLIVDGIKRQEE